MNDEKMNARFRQVANDEAAFHSFGANDWNTGMFDILSIMKYWVNWLAKKIRWNDIKVQDEWQVWQLAQQFFYKMSKQTLTLMIMKAIVANMASYIATYLLF